MLLYLVFVAINLVVAFKTIRYGKIKNFKYFQENNLAIKVILLAFVVLGYAGTILALIAITFSIASYPSERK